MKSYTKPPSLIKWHNNYLVEIFFSCGTACGSSVFVNIYTNEEKSYPTALAVDKKRDVLAFEGDGLIMVAKIFDENKNFIINRDFSIAYPFTKKAKFTSSGTLLISYMTGKEYLDKTEEIQINLSSE